MNTPAQDSKLDGINGSFVQELEPDHPTGADVRGEEMPAE